MFTALCTKYISLLQLGTRPSCCLFRAQLRTQIANFVYVSSIQRDNSNGSFTTRVLYQHPTAHRSDKKTYEINVIFAEDDASGDVCWAFQIAEGEDLISRLEEYALAFGKHDSGDEYYDEYVHAFQSKIAGLVWAMKENSGIAPTKRRSRGRPKRSLPSFLSPGTERDRVIKQRLEEGQSFVELAISLKRTPQFIEREAKRILSEPVANSLKKKKKKQPWSTNEIEYLKMQRKAGIPLRKMMRLLRRTRIQIEAQLKELQTDLSEFNPVEGPQELPLELQHYLFEERLVAIWQHLLESRMTSTWKVTIQRRSYKDWLSTISACVPEDVKRILGAIIPPTWEQLKILPQVSTDDAGVYARLLVRDYPSEIMPSDRYLYIGSASRYAGGLNWRIHEHMLRGRKSRLKRQIKMKGLVDIGFVMLMSMKMSSPEREDILNVRWTVTLAEAIFTIWLGALQQTESHTPFNPWDTFGFDYTGLSSHNPLEYDVVEPRSATPL